MRREGDYLGAEEGECVVEGFCGLINSDVDFMHGVLPAPSPIHDFSKLHSNRLT